MVDGAGPAIWRECKAEDRSPDNCNSKGQEERLRQEAREAAQQGSKETGDRGLQGGQGVAVSQVSDGTRASPGSAAGPENRVQRGEQKAPGGRACGGKWNRDSAAVCVRKRRLRRGGQRQSVCIKGRAYLQCARRPRGSCCKRDRDWGEWKQACRHEENWRAQEAETSPPRPASVLSAEALK